MTASKPLDGIRVLDLTAWQAGPTVAMLLADFGAEVLKIEAPDRLDGWRGGSNLMIDQAYEKNSIWNGVNRNKLGLSLDLRSPKGQEVFLRLVAESDIVVENYTPRVMENFGLGYDVLRAANERIIFIALSGFGATGPWRDYSAFAFPTEEVSGLTYLNGRAGGPPLLFGQSVTDGFAGAMGFFAVLAALWKREHNGTGEAIDLSQIETLTTYLAPEILQAQLTGEDRERHGNRRPGMVPHGLFPCLPEGRFVAIAVRNDAEFAAFCRAIGRLDLASDSRFQTITARTANEDALEELIRGWTRQIEGHAVVECLQADGIPSAKCLTPTEMLLDEQLWSRNWFTILDRQEIGPQPYAGPYIRLFETPGSLDRPAPLYGQHTQEILTSVLGMMDAELAELEALGVTSVNPNSQDWR